MAVSIGTAAVVTDDWNSMPAANSPPADADSRLPGGLCSETADGSDDPDGADWGASPAMVLVARPSAAEVRDGLIERVAAGGDVAIDASAVERLPVPVIQVLLAAIRELGVRNRRLIVRNPSFSFSLAFEALGFGPDREAFTVEYC